jgi:hypothetical protein
VSSILLFVAFPWCIAALFQELAYVQGGSLCCSSFGLVVCALCLSLFGLGCVEPLPLSKGSETCLLQVILLFAFLWILIAC